MVEQRTRRGERALACAKHESPAFIDDVRTDGRLFCFPALAVLRASTPHTMVHENGIDLSVKLVIAIASRDGFGHKRRTRMSTRPEDRTISSKSILLIPNKRKGQQVKKEGVTSADGKADTLNTRVPVFRQSFIDFIAKDSVCQEIWVKTNAMRPPVKQKQMSRRECFKGGDTQSSDGDPAASNFFRASRCRELRRLINRT